MNEHQRRSSPRTMLRFELKSNLLRACCYQPGTRMMALQMRSGGWRIYGNISDAMVHELVSHPAPGSFYHRILRVSLGAPLSQSSPNVRIFYYRLRKLR